MNNNVLLQNHDLDLSSQKRNSKSRIFQLTFVFSTLASTARLKIYAHKNACVNNAHPFGKFYD